MIGLFPAALLFAAAAVAADDPPVDAADWTLSRNEWRWPFAADGTLAVTNEYGDVRVRVHEPGELYALAHIQRHRDDPRRAVIALDAHENPPRLAVRYEPDEADDPPPAWNRRRVDLTIFVPPAVALSVATTAGLAEVRGTHRPLAVTTDTGPIRLRLAGPVQARSRHGAIEAFFLAGGWPTAASLETVTGAIEVTLAEGLAADVSLATHGRITTDFSLLIDRRTGTDFKQAQALTPSLVSSGALRHNRLTLTSDRGAIALLGSTVAAQTQGDHQ